MIYRLKIKTPNIYHYHYDINLKKHIICFGISGIRNNKIYYNTMEEVDSFIKECYDYLNSELDLYIR